jgi:type IV pilus assembly protein PilA
MIVDWKGWIAVGAVVALVMAVAIPSYGDYVHRSQVSEAVSLLAGAKQPLSEYFIDQKKWPRSLDEVAGNLNGKYVQGMTISKGAGGRGEIELSAVLKTAGVDSRVAGKSVRLLSSDGGRSWLCRRGTVDDKHLPRSCRDDQ